MFFKYMFSFCTLTHLIVEFLVLLIEYFSLICMGLDKSWMKIIDRTQLVYEKGVIDFIEVAFIDLEEGKLI